MIKHAPLPAAIWALGLTSLFMDISSEMIHALLPLYITGTLGAGVFALGLIEGVAEATALIIKIFSGVISDITGKRKILALLGYGMRRFQNRSSRWRIRLNSSSARAFLIASAKA